MKTAQLVALGATTVGGQIDVNGVTVATMLPSGDCTITPAGEIALKSGVFAVAGGAARFSRSTAVVESVLVGAIGAIDIGTGTAEAVGAET
jgi:hypothetical protein